MADQSRIAARITRVLFMAQALGSAGFIAVAAVNSIAGASLSGVAAWAGAPSAVSLLGSAFAALVWGYAMDPLGRRGALVMGLVFGAAGAGVAAAAIYGRSFWGFLGGLLLIGAAQGALQLSRFAAAEVHPSAMRGRAIANVVLGGTVGAIVGPLLVGPTGQWASSRGWDELVGPYAAGLLLFILASLTIYILLRPDPRDLARDLARRQPKATPVSSAPRSIRQIVTQPPVIVAMSAMIIGQMVMVMLMVITSLHMKVHNHSLTNISLVLSAHTIGMFAFSLLSGRLADRLGRIPVIVLGAVTLIAAALLAPLSYELAPLAGALFLLGLGWNFCYVAGSSLLADHLSQAERARVQGFNDLLVGLSSALASLGSGLVYAAVGYAVMGIVAALTALVALAIALWWQNSNARRLAEQRAGPSPV
jgi:MFS family permease